MIICRKTYLDIPFAHRQHRHPGHCAFIHGHNWSFTLVFGCKQCDENGFVIDFGQLRLIRAWIEQHLDHACVLNRDDTLKDTLLDAASEAFKVYEVECCSCEGLARHLFQIFDQLVRTHSGGRAFLIKIEVREDRHNAVSYRP